MENGRQTLLSFGHSPGAPLPTLMIFIILAIAAVLCSIGCSSGESISSDFPAVFTRDAAQGGGDVLETPVDIRIREPGLPGREGRTRADDWWLVRRLDLFVFNDDGILSLDSYTRSYAYSTTAFTIHSSSGEKVVVAIANHAFPDEVVTGIHSYADLCRETACFTDDHPSYPVMSGEAAFSAGPGHSCSVVLEPLMCSIELKSLKCRMEGGAQLRNVRVYLTGVSNRAEILRGTDFLPSETLNNGGLSETDLGRLAYSGMVYKYLGNGKAGTEGTTYGSAVLYCYPNEAEAESFASPYTRLVVEGTLDGKTCYYPIPINRGSLSDAGTEGIGRNRRYVFDLTLTRPGTGSPEEDVLSPP